LLTNFTSEKFEKIPSGEGVSLGSIESTLTRISKLDSDHVTLKRLHLLLFGSVGKQSTRKREIRAWNGCIECDHAKLFRNIELTKSSTLLRDLCALLGLERGKTRSETEKTLLAYLLKPHSQVSNRIKSGKSKKTKKTKKTKSSIKKSTKTISKDIEKEGEKKVEGSSESSDDSSSDDSSSDESSSSEDTSSVGEGKSAAQEGSKE
jgi:hypothetical protein